MRVTALIAMVAALPAAALAQSAPPVSSEPIAQVGLYGYRADGSIAGSAYDTAPDLTSFVFVTAGRCGFGASNRPAPDDATDVWQFTGKVISSTPEQAVVQLDWRRTVAAGRRVSGNESSLQLTLRRDEPVQLDHAALPPTCHLVSVGFEARYEPRFASLTAGGLGFRKGAGAGQTSVSAGGGGVRLGAGSGGGSGTGGGTGVSIGGATAASGVGSGSSTGLFDVNLWLVRSVPGQPDEVTHSRLRMNHDGASFSFAPIAVTTSRGDAIVQVTGSLAVVRGSSGEEQLVFTTARRVMHTTAQTPHDAAETQGSSRIVNRMPGPDEVLSFEMPPIKVNNQQAPDQLSVRLKVAPAR
jgi:hypothetical protein